MAGPASAADSVKGQVLGGGAPIAKSTVTLWAASASAPKQLAQTQTGADGRFALRAGGAPGKDAVLYLVAKGGEPAANKGSGDNPAIALLTVLGSKPPAKVIDQRDDDRRVGVDQRAVPRRHRDQGSCARPADRRRQRAELRRSRRPAAGASAIQDPLNSSQTPTMANFATLADVLAGCVTRVTRDACGKLFAAATPPKGDAPTDTLTAAESIARYPWYQPEQALRAARRVLSGPAGQDHARRCRSCRTSASRRAPGCCR